MLFTPRTETGERLSMQIKKKFIPRGVDAKGEVYEVETLDGDIYRCRVASCGLENCFCDAEILDYRE